MVGQTGNTLTCDVSGAGNLNPTIEYRWTRNGEAVPDGSSSTLTLSPLTLSSAGEYVCNVTVRSSLLSNDISTGTPQRVDIQSELTSLIHVCSVVTFYSVATVPAPQSVTITSSGGNVVNSGSSISVNCAVELGSAVMESELSLLMVSAQLFRDGAMLTLTGPTVTGTTFAFDTIVSSFGEGDIGNYSCTATVRSQPSSTFLTGTGELQSSPFEISK